MYIHTTRVISTVDCTCSRKCLFLGGFYVGQAPAKAAQKFSVDISPMVHQRRCFSWIYFFIFWAHCNLYFEDDDDDDGSVNHQKSSHVDMTNDHLQDNNGQTKQVNHSIVWFLSPKKPLKDFDILFIWAWKTKTLCHCIVCLYKIIIQASFLNQKSMYHLHK